ncbi:Tctex1 domain-containing protein 3 [Irineochytrium annulatum]|nr:Tctex1 domain-containing protein 3 [Irineochytrium annulatum]
MSSKENLAGKAGGSRSDLTTGGAGGGSKHGSIRNLASQKQQVPPPPVEQPVPPTNAIVYENTYAMKPDRKFQSEPVRKLTEEILKTSLLKVKYDAEKVPDISMKLANEILAAIKKLEYDRYKFVVDITIGEFKGQGIRVASRCLWDTSTDSFASASFRNGTLFAVAIVFACYYE